MSEAKEFYRKNYWHDAPLFHLPWWLDAVAEDNWDACVIKNESELHAYFLYSRKKDFAGIRVFMPELTQFLGPNYKVTASSTRERLNEETEILEMLQNQIPSFAVFDSRWHFQFQNWLPFYWKSFKQSTRYTYLLDDISTPAKLYENFSEKIQREIKKAEKQFKVEATEDILSFHSLLVKNFMDKKIKVPFEKALLEKIFKASKMNNAGKILLAKDESGKVAAGIFIAWDSGTAYYIIGAKDSDFGNSGAMSLLFWIAFNELKSTVKSFDFEGSMIRGVENYFRSFGAAQKGFFEITKINSPLLKGKSALRSLLRRR